MSLLPWFPTPAAIVDWRRLLLFAIVPGGNAEMGVTVSLSWLNNTSKLG